LRDGRLIEEKWHKVVVGDIIKMENNQFVAVSKNCTYPAQAGCTQYNIM
jgi:hypothetical protein